jgi:tetratricopeptide (TPR) repeat protein
MPSIVSDDGELLQSLPSRITDEDWIRFHLNEIYHAIRTTLSVNRPLAVTSILLVFPQVLQNEALKAWAKLLQQTVGKREYMPILCPSLGPVYLFPERPHLFIPTPKKRRRDRINPRQIFEMYLHLLMADTPNLHDVTDTLMLFTRRVNTPYYTYKMYQTFAFLFNGDGDYERAQDYLTIIGDFFKDEPLDQALTDYARGVAWRGLGRMEKAVPHFERARATFPADLYPEQYAALVRDLDGGAA